MKATNHVSQEPKLSQEEIQHTSSWIVAITGLLIVMAFFLLGLSGLLSVQQATLIVGLGIALIATGGFIAVARRKS